jgi:outer membrane immunogenic protein
MRRLLSFVATTTLLFAGALGAASAADLPPPPIPYVPVAQFSWSGFYIGANAGYGWTAGSGTLTTALGSQPFSLNGNGFVGGAQAGYNWQVNSFVLGVEADFQGTTSGGPFNATGIPIVNATDKMPWFGTLRGRVGYAMDRVLIYATGGGVYGDNTLNGNLSTVGPFSTSETFWTWTAGGGVEAAFWGCWSAKLEYLYMASPNATPSIPTVTALNESAHANIIRAGLNYHF